MTAACLAALLWPGRAGARLQGFAFEDVCQAAADAAAQPYRAPEELTPKILMDPNLSYDEWRDIRFNQSKALWRDENLPFEVQFFHVGLYYDRPVKINVIDGENISPVNYDQAFFNYGRNVGLGSKLPPNLGFAGFRLHYPIKTPAYKDEVAVFLGASYFKGIGRDHHYGLSARGLAVDTAVGRPEEFPWFREFWLVKPRPEDTSLTVYALLDSPSIAGAYEFQIIPGLETITEVRSRIIQRRGVEALGIAPLTSMFMYGENANCRPDDDFRPEVHDSDGLLLHSGSGEWLWRPLSIHGDRVLTNAFYMEEPRGFGLMQRDRAFDHYQDLEANYQDRPSAFVVPRGDWGPGEVRLVQIPSDSEINDNIVAFWTPRAPAEPGRPMDFDYTLSWTSDAPEPPETGRAAATRRARGTAGEAVRFIIDFEGPQLSALPASAGVEAQVTAGEEVELLDSQVRKNPATGGWRLVFQVKPKKTDSSLEALLSGPQKPLVEMRAFLSLEGAVLTETWSYGADL
jgi:glucans biosynthesis protein